MRQSSRLLLLMCLLPTLGLSQTVWTDVTADAGIDHQFEVFEGMFGGGACVFDFDNDGFEDLFLTSGMQQDQLYRNNGDGTFTDVYEGSGLEETRHYVTQGIASADVNKDGWVDLFITTITSKDSVKTIPREINLFFLNKGDGTFRNATREFRLSNYNSFSTAAAFGDVNQDGYVDLYIGNYFLAYEGKLSVINDATIVGANQTSKDYLLINVEGRYFEDAYEDYELDHRGFGFGGVFSDYDNDGDIDILVNNDFGYKAVPNYLLRNDYPRKRFTNTAKDLDMDLKINSMGTAVGDFNEDGLLDYFFTNIRFNKFMVHEEPSVPYADILKSQNMNVVTISWGANFADFDQDGDVDLFVGNGDLNPNCVPMANFYFENNEGQFTELGRAKGINDYGMARGTVTFDIESDGDLDLLVVNQKPVYDNYPVASRTILYRNDSTSGNWLQVKLEGTTSDNRGLGARVVAVIGGRRLLREVDGGGSSHMSQNSPIVHFGLGDAEVVDSLIVRWPVDHTQVLTDVAANQKLVVLEEPFDQDSNTAYISFLMSIVVGGFFVALFLIRRRDSLQTSS